MKNKFLTPILWLAVLAVIAGALLIFEGDFLWKTQEMNLFLNTPHFLSQQMVVAGGFLTWLGTYFTQHLFHPWLGVLLLCGWWLLLMWLVKHTFAISDQWAVLTVIPVALLLLTITDQGYWVYMLKLRGHFFLTTIATTLVVALLWAFKCLPSKYGLRPAFVVLTAAIGYPLLGIYGLAAALLMAVWAWRLQPEKRGLNIATTVTALLAIVAVPLICYRYVYYQANIANIYYAALPLFSITDEHHQYYIPYYLLLLYFLLLTVCYGRSLPQKYQPKAKRLPLVQGALLVAVAAAVFAFWYKDENFHRELKMEHCIDRLDWQGVIDEAAKQQTEPTRAIVMMRNLALARLGRQGSEMFNFKNGSKQSNAPFNVRMMQVAGTLIYYHYGLVNYCNRLCSEEGVEYGWRAEYLKYMARCAILNGEQQAARKFLHILGQTAYFGEWAERLKPLADNPKLVATDAEMQFIAQMMHYPSKLDSDQGFVESFLMKLLANSYSKTPVFQEQALLAAMWTKDIKLFWPHFMTYAQLHPNQPMPRLYQEAAYLYGQLEKTYDVSRMPFDKSVKQTYDNFMKMAPRMEGQDIEDAREALYPLFGNTFYYDYFLMGNLPEY